MIEIRIKAPPKSGKTTIAARIVNALRQCGYKVRVDDDDPRITQQQDEEATVHVYTEQAREQSQPGVTK